MVIDATATELPQLGSDALLDHVLREFYGRLRIHQSALQRMHRARVVGVDEAGVGGEYSALARYLVRQRGRSLTMDLDEIANLVGGLPPAAYERQAWWANIQTHDQASAWMDAGWKVVSVNLNTQSVRFVR